VSLALFTIEANNKLVMDTSNQITLQIPLYIIKDSGHSIDTHFQNGAVTVSVSHLPIMADN
jgi:hypothetical protein